MTVGVVPQLQFHTWVTVQVVVNSNTFMKENLMKCYWPILNKKKKLSFGDDTDFESKRAKFDVQADTNEDTADTMQMTTIPCAKETTSELNNSSPHALSMLAENVTSNQNLPNNPPNPISFTDTPLVNEAEHGEESEDEKMLPLIDITDDITG